MHTDTMTAPEQFPIGTEVRFRRHGETGYWTGGLVRSVKMTEVGHLHRDLDGVTRSCDGAFEYTIGSADGDRFKFRECCTGRFDIASAERDPARWDQDALESSGDLQLVAHDFDLAEQNETEQLRQFEVSITDGPEYDDDIARRPRDMVDWVWIELHHPSGQSAKIRLDRLLILALTLQTPPE